MKSNYDVWLTSALAYECFAGVDVPTEEDEDPFAGPDDLENEDDDFEDDEDLYLGLLG